MNTVLEITISNAITATLLAGVVFAVQRVIRRTALVHCLWLLVMLKLVTPPLIPIRVPAMLQGVLSGDFGASLSHSAAISSPSIRILIGIWVAGSTIFAVIVGWRVVRFERLLRFASPANQDLQNEVDELARQIGLSRSPQLCLVPGRISPLLWSFIGHARILFPTDLLTGLSKQSREALLIHELSHMKRRDHWVRYFELFVTGLYWWHPVVWFSRSQLHVAEEQCCDARVVSQTPKRLKPYVDGLLTTIDFMSHRPLPVASQMGGLGSANSIRSRLAMILRGSVPIGLTRRCRLAVLIAAGIVLPFWPSWTKGESRDLPGSAVLIASNDTPRFDVESP